MKLKSIKRMLALILIVSLSLGGVHIFAHTVSAASTAPYDAFNNTSYGRTYTLATSGRQTVYTSSNLKTPGNNRGACNAWIDCAADELWVFDVGVTNGTYWAYVSYPVSNGRRTGYIPLSTITTNTHAVTATATGRFYCAPRKGQANHSSYWVDKGDRISLIAINGDQVQLIYPASGGRYRIAWAKKSDYEKWCGSIPGNTSDIIKAPSSSTANPVSGSFVRIRYSANGRCLDVPAEGISKNGTQLQIWDYTSGNQNQIFQLVDTGKGWHIISLQSGKVVEVRNSSHNDCAQVAQWSKHNLACARWDIIKNSNGSVSFRNCESGKYLNVSGGGNAGNAAKIIQYHNDKSPAMQFFIEPVTCGNFTTVTSTIASSKIMQEKNLNVRNWHPLNGLTETMLAQDDSMEALVDVPVLLDAATFALEWLSNSSSITRIHVTEGKNKQLSIRYGSSIELNRSGKNISLVSMLTEYHSGEASYILWAASDADKCIRSWFGLGGNGKYTMEMTFGNVKCSDYGYALLIKNGAVYQTPLIHPDSTYPIYYKENGKWNYVMDAANILRSTQLLLVEDDARTVMIQLVKNGYVK